ncbi:MAG: hypothetical protein BWX84_01826 [Verrucomicrobia bacterium ADurb.Bin118]|jgi:hypothetical protein|nr:MAG: hypothetical protein BWX84_01826 [Verrucomicrobia bacterium ADurb.Bin118]
MIAQSPGSADLWAGGAGDEPGLPTPAGLTGIVGMKALRGQAGPGAKFIKK